MSNRRVDPRRRHEPADTLRIRVAALERLPVFVVLCESGQPQKRESGFASVGVRAEDEEGTGHGTGSSPMARKSSASSSAAGLGAVRSFSPKKMELAPAR